MAMAEARARRRAQVVPLAEDERIDTAEVARLTIRAAATVQKWRQRGQGPPYHRDPLGRVYYLKREVLAWMAEGDD